jgi:hypothetical protein
MWREGKKRCFCSEEKKKKHSNWTTGKKTLDNLATPKDPAFSVATSPNDDKNSSTEDGANIDGDNEKKYEKISSAKKIDSDQGRDDFFLNLATTKRKMPTRVERMTKDTLKKISIVITVEMITNKRMRKGWMSRL